jgi:hypothetical protein
LQVDISTARLAQLLGQDGLGAWLDDVPVGWEDLPFAAVAVCLSHLHGPFLWGSCRYWPGLDPDQRARLEPSCPRSVSPPRRDTHEEQALGTGAR